MVMKQPVTAGTGPLRGEWERESNPLTGRRWGRCRVRTGADLGCFWPSGGECLAPQSLSVAGRALGPGCLGGTSAVVVGDLGSPFPTGRERPGGCPAATRQRWGRGSQVLGALRAAEAGSSLLLSPKANADSWFAHRFVALQEWWGADHAVLAGGCGHPPQLREEDFWQIHQSSGLPPPTPAPGGHGGLQPGAFGQPWVPGADSGGLSGHTEIRSKDR